MNTKNAECLSDTWDLLARARERLTSLSCEDKTLLEEIDRWLSMHKGENSLKLSLPANALTVNDIADRLGACLGWLNCTLRPPITVSRCDIIEALETVIDALDAPPAPVQADTYFRNGKNSF